MNAPVQQLQPIDAVERSLINCWRDVSRATHRFLTLLREFDLRQGWAAYGNTDCAQWLNWRCGISRTTAQEKVRVARALWTRPLIDAAFGRGELSYSKVRALTRVPDDHDEAVLLDYALGVPAARLEAYCRQLRNGDAVVSAGDARRVFAARSLVVHHRDDGSSSLTIELPRASADLVTRALARCAAGLPEDAERSLVAIGADALVRMAEWVLAGEAVPAEDASAGDSRPHTHEVVVHVDATALCGQGGLSDLQVETVKRLCCDGPVVPLTEDGDGNVLNVGRRQRTVPAAIRRAVQSRDRHCTFPGCDYDRWVEYHHIQHWADGGETSADNLTLLCSHHHRLIHEGGFGLARRHDGSCYFVRPDGRPVEAAVEPEEPGDSDAESYVVEEARRLYVVSDVRRNPASPQPSSAEDPPSAEGEIVDCYASAIARGLG